MGQLHIQLLEFAAVQANGWFRYAWKDDDVRSHGWLVCPQFHMSDRVRARAAFAVHFEWNARSKHARWCHLGFYFFRAGKLAVF